MRRRWIFGGLGVAVVAGMGILAAVAIGRTGKDDKPPEKPLEFTTAEVVQPLLTPLPVTIEFSGPLVAPSTAIVRAKAGGTLLALQAEEGTRVLAGQRIATLDLADLNARLAEREAIVESSRAQLAQIERTHRTNERLAEQQFISTSALDNSHAAYDSARAQLNAAMALRDTVRVGLRDAALVAPIAGIVAKRHAVPGEKLAVEQEVVTIVDLKRLEMAGSVGTHEVSRLSPGMNVQLKIEGFAEPMAARLARIAPAADPGMRSIRVTVDVANADEKLRAGQYAVATVLLPDDTPRMTVPVGAIAAVSGQEYVWTVEQGKLMRRTVTTGRRDAARGMVEVLQGLPAGSQVLAARFENLREGAQASVARTAAKPVASAAAPSPTSVK